MNKVIIEVEWNILLAEFVIRANNTVLARSKTPFTKDNYVAMLSALCKVAGIEFEVKEVSK